jgi:hypothetical protein
MINQMLDIAIAIVLLVAGISLVALGERDLGSVVVTAALGYIAGAYRDKPGGLDEAVRLGEAELHYVEDGE